MTCLVLSGACLRLSWTQSSSQETPQKPTGASFIVFCKEFVAPRRPQDTPGATPKTTRCILYCFLQGICSPKRDPRRPRAILYCFLQAFWAPSRSCIVFYKHFGVPATAANLRQPSANRRQPPQPWEAKGEWRTLGLSWAVLDAK